MIKCHHFAVYGARLWSGLLSSQVKAFMKHLISQKKKEKPLNFQQEQSFRPAASHAGCRNGLLYSAFCPCAFATLALLPLTRQSFLSDGWFFSPVIFAVVCADTDISAKTSLLPVHQCVERRESSLSTMPPFLFFLQHSSKSITVVK